MGQMGHKHETQEQFGNGLIKPGGVRSVQGCAKLGAPGHPVTAELITAALCPAVPRRHPAVHLGQKIQLNRDVVLRLGIGRVLMQAAAAVVLSHFQ